MKKISLLVAIVFVISLTAPIMAASDTATQSVTMVIPEVAKLRVQGGDVTLTISAPTTAGDIPSNITDNNTRLQYTSIVASGKTRKITIKWSGAQGAPNGTSLKAAATIGSSGQGARGDSAGQVTVSGSDQDFITGIGSSVTATAAGNGATGTYTLSVDDISLMVEENKSETITFTLTDDA